MDRMAQLQAMLAKDPEDAFCLYGLAMEYQKQGDLDQAVTHFDRAIESDPDSCYSYYHKARCLDDLGRRDDALTTLQVGLVRAHATNDGHAAAEIEALLDDLA